MSPELTDMLVEIGSGIGGVDAGSLSSKALKEELHELGYVWPKYGATFRLTPAGKRACFRYGLREPAPFNVIGETELRAKRDECCDSDWDRRHFDEWMEKAL